MNLRCVRLMILIVSGVLTGAEVRADWPDWGGTPFWRWTGYGFGDGYHQACCRPRCGQGTAAKPVGGGGGWPSPTNDTYRWSRPVPILPGAAWPTAAQATGPRLASPAVQRNIPY